MSPFLLLCFKAPMGPSGHVSGRNNHFACFPARSPSALCLLLRQREAQRLSKRRRGPGERGRLGGTSGSNWDLLGSLSVGLEMVLSGGSGGMCWDMVGAHGVLSSTWLGGTCEHVCMWEIMKKSNTVSHRGLSFLLMGGRRSWCYGSC